MSTIFTKIIRREIPATIVFEDDDVLAFRDIAPKAPTHILIIPKREIVGLSDLTADDEAVMGKCVVAAAKIAAEQGITHGYRLVVNCGEDGGQEVPHLHFHLLAGRKMTWPPG